MAPGDLSRQYLAALQGAVVFDGSAYGRLRVWGRDAARLLHRLSTNDILSLTPGQGCRTVLTTHYGRILDVLTLYARQEDIQIITGAGQQAAIAQLLRRNILFRDQVTVEEKGDETALFLLYGPQMLQVLSDCGALGAAELALHHHRSAWIKGVEVELARELPIGGEGFALLVAMEVAETIRRGLLAEGAVPLSQPVYDILRVEQGYGAWGREFSRDYIPLEAGLWDAVSFSKGCYVGQEIIARMESRTRIARRLRGIRLEAEVEAPADLLVDGNNAGTLTTAVVSPRFGPIGLAYLREAYQATGQPVAVSGTSVSGAVTALPFDGE